MRTSSGRATARTGAAPGRGASRRGRSRPPRARPSTARRWSSASNGPEKTPLLRASSPSPTLSATSVDEVVAQRLEQRPQLGGGEAGLEVVEQHVVGVRGVLEAGDVAVAQLDVARERVAEVGEVRRRAGLLPLLLADGVGVADLGGELGGDADRLLVVAPDGRDQADVVAVGVLALRPRLEHLEELPDHRVGELAVADQLERGRVVGAGGGPARRHHRVLVPEQHRVDAAEVGQLGHPLLERSELGGSGAHEPARA